MITNNEKRMLRFLLADFDRDYSINELAKECSLAPNGAYEILKKLETRGIVLPKRIANLKSYKINFDSIEAIKLLELILIPDFKDNRISYRLDDLKPLQEISKLCIIFGSYITKKAEPNDIDVLFVIKKADYKKYNHVLEKVKRVVPIKLHDVIQTRQDLINNIKNKDKITNTALKNGVILWGHEFLVKMIKDVAKG